MHRYYVHQAWRAAAFSGFERDALRGGVATLAAAIVVAVFSGDAGGLARWLGTAGLAALTVAAGSRAARHHRAGARAALPTSLAPVRVRARPLLAFSVLAFAFALALGLPLAVVAAVLVVTSWGWLAVAGLVLLGCAAMSVTWVGETRRGEEPCSRGSAHTTEVLGRLAMRADLPAPMLVVGSGPVATAWTVGGRICVTRPLLPLLSDAELEAVLAHELAHLAHRDAAAIEICSAPSRVLLASRSHAVAVGRRPPAQRVRDGPRRRVDPERAHRAQRAVGPARVRDRLDLAVVRARHVARAGVRRRRGGRHAHRPGRARSPRRS